MQKLTRLQLSSCSIQQDVLAGQTRLQHLCLNDFTTHDAAVTVPQLLQHLQQLQQLTHLLASGSWGGSRGNPPATACSAITANSKLQHLNMAFCRLPAYALQHVIPAGRQLPLLTALDISWVAHSMGDAVAPSEIGRLFSCCPALLCLDMRGWECNAALLAPLQGLSGLHTLHLSPCGVESVDYPPPRVGQPCVFIARRTNDSGSLWHCACSPPVLVTTSLSGCLWLSQAQTVWTWTFVTPHICGTL